MAYFCNPDRKQRKITELSDRKRNSNPDTLSHTAAQAKMLCGLESVVVSDYGENTQRSAELADESGDE